MYEGIIIPAKATRMYTAELHNAVINHPSVKSTFGKTDGPVDVAPLLDDPDSYVLMAHGGTIAIFEWSAPDVWQAHYAAINRGRVAVDGLKAIASAMFGYGARMIWGQIPVTNKPALVMANAIGALKSGYTDREAEGCCALFTLGAV